MIPDGERDLFRDVGLEQLRCPPAMVGFHQRLPQIVQQTSKRDLFRESRRKRFVRALQNVRGRRKSKLEKIEQGRLCRHWRQARNVLRLVRQAIAEWVGASGSEQSTYAP